MNWGLNFNTGSPAVVASSRSRNWVSEIRRGSSQSVGSSPGSDESSKGLESGHARQLWAAAVVESGKASVKESGEACRLW